MGGKVRFTFLFSLMVLAICQDVNVTENAVIESNLCDMCTCSEIPDLVDETYVVLNILCSDLEKNQHFADLDKISWPPNPNGLNISAAFVGLGLSTLGKMPSNAQVETLRLTNNEIKAYWPDPFSGLPNLKKLSFSQNELVDITPDLFTHIEELEDLDLSYNKLIEINPLEFKLLKHVKKLNFQNNELKKIPVEALLPMAALEDLDLSRNTIFDLMMTKGRHGLVTLTRLNLSGNKIRSVMNNSFPPKNSLEFLDLSHNIIEMVETEAFLSCVNLRELNLAHNSITLVFALPPSLQIAILKVNALFHWPMFPSGIKYIDLSYNKLSDMYDENRTGFDSLEFFNIGGNQIKELNVQRKLPNLYIFDVSYNLLAEIPKTLSSQFFPNLEELHLDGNVFESIYFRDIIALNRLYLTDLPKLRVVEDKSFSNVVGRGEDEANCFSLYLSNCPALSEIRESAFDGTSLCMLDISSNNLSTVPRGLVSWARVPDGVNAQFNPWRCSCDLQWMLDELLPALYNNASAKYLAELRCGAPSSLKGTRLVHWYNWTARVMCDDVGSRTSYTIEYSSSREQSNWMQILIIAAICLSIVIIISLTVYLARSRRRHRVLQATVTRKRQRAEDNKDENGVYKDQLTVLAEKRA